MSLSMKSASLSILALAALGVAACTITSGTVDDTGIRDGGPDLTDGSTGGDSGPDADASFTCDQNKQGQTVDGGGTAIISANCQACLESQCCAALVSCFNKTVNVSVDGTCDDIKDCYDACATSNDPATCYAGCNAGNPGVSEEWRSVRSCGATSCTAECPNIDPAASHTDGG